MNLKGLSDQTYHQSQNDLSTSPHPHLDLPTPLQDPTDLLKGHPVEATWDLKVDLNHLLQERTFPRRHLKTDQIIMDLSIQV